MCGSYDFQYSCIHAIPALQSQCKRWNDVKRYWIREKYKIVCILYTTFEPEKNYLFISISRDRLKQPVIPVTIDRLFPSNIVYLYMYWAIILWIAKWTAEFRFGVLQKILQMHSTKPKFFFWKREWYTRHESESMLISFCDWIYDFGFREYYHCVRTHIRIAFTRVGYLFTSVETLENNEYRTVYYYIIGIGSV